MKHSMKHLFLPVLRESYLLIVQNQNVQSSKEPPEATQKPQKKTGVDVIQINGQANHDIFVSAKHVFFCIYVCISVWLWVYSPVLYLPLSRYVHLLCVCVSISLHRCIYLSIYIVDMICVLCELIHVFVRLSICRQPHYVWYGLGIVSFAAFWKVGLGSNSTCMYLRGSVSAY